MIAATDFTQIALFLAGVLVHFAYIRFVNPAASPTPPPGNPLNSSEAFQLLKALVERILAKNAAEPTNTPPTLASTTEHALIELLKNVVAQAVNPPAPPPDTAFKAKS